MSKPSPALEWKGFTPFQFVSLYEMLVAYHYGALRTLLSGMQAIQDELESLDEDNIDGETHAHLFQRLIEYQNLCQIFEIDVTECAGRLRMKLIEPGRLKYPVKTYWLELRHRVSDELARHLWMYVPSADAQMYNSEMLFGQQVYDSFPSAREDIQLAGNCYVFGCYTATVFHLMRAVEVGAKAMVHKMGANSFIGKTVDVKGKKVFRRKPIDLCDWKTLCDGLAKALQSLEAGSGQSIAKKRKLMYYSHAVAQFRAFKDAWRNTVSHSHEIVPDRKQFLEGETKDILNNTRQYFNHLAQKISEK